MKVVDRRTLFHKNRLDELFRQQYAQMSTDIDRFTDDYLLNTSLDDLLNYFEQKYLLEVPILDETSVEFDQQDKKVEVSDYFDGRVLINGTRYTFFVPFTGDESLFYCQASTFSCNPPYGNVASGQLEFMYDVPANTPAEAIKSELDSNLRAIKEALQWTVTDVDREYNSKIRSYVQSKIEARRNKLLNDRQVAMSLGFPMRRREDAPKTFATPTIRRKIAPALPTSKSHACELEPTLDMENYEYILSVMMNMALAFERSPEAYKTMEEEAIRQHFLVHLNGHYEGQATGETFNMGGKTDILVRVKGKNIFIAECKFWKGPAQFTETINQLLGYLSWRDTKAALVIFNRGTKLSTVLAKIPGLMEAHSNFTRKLEYRSETGFRYILHHNDDKNREIMVTVLVFEVPE